MNPIDSFCNLTWMIFNRLCNFSPFYIAHSNFYFYQLACCDVGSYHFQMMSFILRINKLNGLCTGELMPMFSGTFPPGGEGNPLAGGILLLSPKGLKGCSIMVRSYPVRSALTITIEGDTRSLPGTSGQNDPEFVFSLNFISSLKSALVETFCIGLEASQLAKGLIKPKNLSI